MDFLPEGRIYQTQENRASISSPAALQQAMEDGRILEAKAYLCTGSHDLMVSLGCGTGIIPREEAAVGIREGTVRDIAIISRVGHPVGFMVESVGFENGRVRAVLSRRKAQQMCIDQYTGKLVPGDIIPARITRLESFGAFADIGCGLAALMPIDMMSVSRISHPSQRFYTGEDILSIVKTTENGRISLSHKELLGSWEENAGMFQPGETVRGVVRSVEEYGIFVELTPNLAGLAEKKPGIVPGMTVSVFIKNIIPERMKVKLIIIEGFQEEEIPSPTPYRITEGHLSSWIYSPACCGKKIETVFDQGSPVTT